MFYFTNKQNGKFIAMDNESGGYPYESAMHRDAHMHGSIERAIKYANGLAESKHWQLHEFHGFNSTVVLEDVANADPIILMIANTLSKSFPNAECNLRTWRVSVENFYLALVKTHPTLNRKAFEKLCGWED